MVQQIDWLDLTLFVAMLLVSVAIGFYFAYFAKEKPNTTSQYLMGGRTMGIFPISMSLIASYISGISILGLPAEMYFYGTQFSMKFISEIGVSVAIALFYLPVFYELHITSSYQYLSRRFNTSVSLLGSFIFCVKMLLYIPIVIYVPALAFSQVTGINLHLITPSVCLICIFYTSIGGLKAVVWTDTFQIMIMMLGIVLVLVLGIIDVGSISTVIKRASDSDRLEFFNTDFDPRTRNTLWSVVFGYYFFWLASCSSNQATMQRLLSLPSLRKANIAVSILAVGIAVIVLLCCFTGLVIYATYENCDPLMAKKITKRDQILPLYVMEKTAKIPGLPGIFLSGVFSAALSTMSTGLNSMTGVIYEDLIKVVYKKSLSEAQASFIMKVIVFIIGFICVAMVFVVEQLGTLVQAANSMSGITAGPLLGMFSLGMFFPWANYKGALSGGIVSLIIVACISVGSQREVAFGNIIYPEKHLSISGCTNVSIGSDKSHHSSHIKYLSERPFVLFEISYLWYTFIGTLITLIVGICVSYLTGFTDLKDVDENLLTPFVRHFLSKRKKERETEDVIIALHEQGQNRDEINPELCMNLN